MSYVKPFQTQADLPSATQTAIHGSRLVDISTGRYVYDDQGNAKGDSDVVHLVKMIVMSLPPVKGGIITPRAAMLRRQVLRANLKRLVDGRDIRLQLVSVLNPVPGVMRDVVKFQDLSTGRVETFTRDHN